MNTIHYPSQQQPTIIKISQSDRTGILSHQYARHGIGYVISGKKYIYYGDTRFEMGKGDLFYLNVGNHYTEDVPENGAPFEQIVFYYTPEQLSRILTHLNLDYGVDIKNDHVCPKCMENNHVIYHGWDAIGSFFTNVNQYVREGVFASDAIAENIKMTELVYLIISRSDCCIKNKLLNNSDTKQENFEQIIHMNIFSDKTIEELAKECNRSMTSFKKEFKKHFFEPPHRWFIKQRLMQSRLLLISSKKSVAEIGNECHFPNTSHFIKLFKKEYGMTPSAYRNKYSGNKVSEKQQEKVKV